VLSTISAFQIGRDYHDLGYGLDDPAGVGTGNSRNGFATKTISTTNGPITIDVPRDRNGTFEPKSCPNARGGSG
jgi:transposase-like protein